jgi:hypothetical protein
VTAQRGHLQLGLVTVEVFDDADVELGSLLPPEAVPPIERGGTPAKRYGFKPLKRVQVDRALECRIVLSAVIKVRDERSKWKNLRRLPRSARTIRLMSIELAGQ